MSSEPEKLEPEQVEQEATVPPGPQRKRRLRLIVFALIALVIFAGLVLAGVLPRLARQKKINAAAQQVQQAVPAVTVVQVHEAPASASLQLPGNVEAIQVATISAQTTGYLRRWHVDIGDRVRVGQLLAEIETPQIDQQLQQATANVAQSIATLGQMEANLNQANTNMEYSRITYERNQYLAQQHVVSDQVRDQMKAAYDESKAAVAAAQANINAAKATIAANQANLRSIKVLQGFQKVFSPFAGVITARNVETGSLINQGNNSNNVSTSTGTTPSSAVQPGTGTIPTGTNASANGGGLFEIARIDSLRIYISVPQTYAGIIKPGQVARVSVRELPDKTFQGQVVRTTSALDPGSRTLLTEVQMPNPDYKLLPGMYATVDFGVLSTDPPVRIPATALIINADGPRVAVVTSDQKVSYQKVVIGRDYGNEVDILSGLEPGTTVITNVPDGLADGAPVRIGG
ncbi:MAG TPA: efflux RND transporter periplasmic adaptor subunit [Pyrinomonadaceae bacterium]|nr:efflux RND transporter periplasmic adaptor subunit [Pyrinomonadaceae bacterium]